MFSCGVIIWSSNKKSTIPSWRFGTCPKNCKILSPVYILFIKISSYDEYYEFLTFQNWFFYFLFLSFSSVSDKIFNFSASSHRLEKEHLIWSISFAVVSIKYDVEQMDSDLNCIVSLLMYSLSFYQDIYNLKRPPLRTASSFETKEKQGYIKLNDFNNFFYDCHVCY